MTGFNEEVRLPSDNCINVQHCKTTCAGHMVPVETRRPYWAEIAGRVINTNNILWFDLEDHPIASDGGVLAIYFAGNRSLKIACMSDEALHAAKYKLIDGGR